MKNDTNYTTTTMTNSARITNSSTFKGGKVIASGGFGCVFKPAIKCKGQKRNEKDVTKLMKIKYAKSEYKGIQKYKEMLDRIPNYSDYFLVDGFSLCEPDKLDEEDLRKFDKKCSALKKMKITSSNVNSNLDKLRSLNMPYGGIDVGDYIETTRMDYKKLSKMNISLIELLKNGILPMNENGIYHCDIKDSNILVQESPLREGEVKTRLIDWGLSTEFKERNSIPKPLTKRPLQFNVPFSVVIFNDTFTKMHGEFLKKHKSPTYFETREFVINYVVTWINERGPGHLKSLNNIFKAFFERGLINIEKQFKEDLIEFEYTFYFIFEYISYVIFKFTRDGKFDKMEYFSQVFLKNLDIWGFTMTYLPILEYLENYYDDLCECELEIIDKIKNAVLYVIECSYIPIDVDKLANKLEELNPLFLKAERNSTVKFEERETTFTTHPQKSSKSSSKKKSSSTKKTRKTSRSSSRSSSKKTRRNTV
jgi:serine/threonine protein kinase